MGGLLVYGLYITLGTCPHSVLEITEYHLTWIDPSQLSRDR